MQSNQELLGISHEIKKVHFIMVLEEQSGNHQIFDPLGDN